MLAGVALSALTIVGLPHFVELFTVINATIYVSMAILALSLALLWGFGGSSAWARPRFSDWVATHMLSLR